jgi:hypothetical protein
VEDVRVDTNAQLAQSLRIELKPHGRRKRSPR